VSGISAYAYNAGRVHFVYKTPNSELALFRTLLFWTFETCWTLEQKTCFKVFVLSERFPLRFPIFETLHFCNQQKSIIILLNVYQATTISTNVRDSS